MRYPQGHVLCARAGCDDAETAVRARREPQIVCLS